MKIRTQETVQKYETWEYDLPNDFTFPEGFFSWNGEDKYDYIIQLPINYDARMVNSEHSGLGTVDEIEVVV